jgi:PAS domain S-box-containing protein
MQKNEAERIGLIFEKIASEKKPIRDLENWNLSKKGEMVCLLTNGVPLINESGELTGYRGLDKDITYRKKAEEKIKESEKFLSDVFNSISDGLSVLDKDLNVIKTNKFMEVMYKDKMPFTGKKCFNIYQNRKSICPWCPSLNAMKKKVTQHNIVPYPDSKKPIGWMYLSSYPLIDINGDVNGVIEYVKDITNQKKTEDKLKETTRNLQHIIDASPSAIVTVDKFGKVTNWSPACEEIFGWKKDEVIGKYNPSVPSDMKNFYRETIMEKQKNLEIKALKKDDSFIDISLSTSPVFNDGGEIIGAIGIMTDISERKKIEEEKMQKMQQLETFQDVSVDREIRMIELKKEVNELLVKTGEKPKYKIAE